MKIYEVNPEYINYLRQFDSKVSDPKNDHAFGRKYVGVVLEVNGFYYLAPLTSKVFYGFFDKTGDFHCKKDENGNKIVRKNFTDVYLKDPNGDYVAAVKLNNMIPLPKMSEDFVKEVDYDTLSNSSDEEDKRYGTLLSYETKYLMQYSIVDQINLKARKCLENDPFNEKLNSLCCDFKLLEEKALEYAKQKQIEKEEQIAKENAEKNKALGIPDEYAWIQMHAMSGKKNTEQFFEENLVDMTSEDLEKPTQKWQRDWMKVKRPENAISGIKYTGINRHYLEAYMIKHGFDDPRFCSFTEARENGWKIKKKTKSEAVIKVTVFQYKITHEDGKIEIKEEHIALKDKIAANPNCEITIPFRQRVLTLFNAKQIDGIPPLEKNKKVEKNVTEYVKNAIDAMNVQLALDKSIEHATYDYESKQILVPPTNKFKNSTELSVSMVPELIRATGDEQALNRVASANYRMDSNEKCKEELTIELGSINTLKRIGIETDSQKVTKNHEEYLNDWKKTLNAENGYNFLEEVVKDAQKGSDYIHEKSLQKEKETNIQKEVAKEEPREIIREDEGRER